MKKLLTVGIIVGVCATSTLPVSAANLYFRPETGGAAPAKSGTYTWDTSSSFWYSAATSGTASAWNNNNPAVAYILTQNASFDIQLGTDITLAGFARTPDNQATGTRVLITSADINAPSTLTFTEGATVNYNTTNARYLRFENLKINGDFTVINGGTTLGTGLTFLNSSKITNKGTLQLNAETTADVVMDGGTLNVNVAASTGVAKLSGTGSIARTSAGANGVFKLNQNVNTTLTGRISTVSFTKTGTGTFIMNGGGTHGSLQQIRVDGGAFYTDGVIQYAAGNPPITLSVAAGAKAGGTFTSNRVVVLEAATSVLSPGVATLNENNEVVNHTGTLVLANGITAAEGGTFDFYMDESDGVGGLLNSRIDITGGTVTLDGTKTINLFGLSAGLLEEGVAYTLFDVSGAGSLSEGWNTNWVLGTNNIGMDASLLFSDDGVQVVFVPEPGTNALIMGGFLGLLAFCSRRFAKR